MSIKQALENLDGVSKMRPLAIGFYEEMIQKLDRLAAEYGQSRSEVVRVLVADSLARLEIERKEKE